MKKRMIVLAGLATVAAAVLPSALASASPEGGMTLVAKLDRHSMVKVDNGRKGISAGDTIVFSTSLMRDGEADGRAEFVQTVVDPRYHGISAHADLLLADGTIELQNAGLGARAPGGAKPSRQTEMAIVGGTGAYSGAAGSVRLRPAGPVSQRLDVQFEG